MPAYSYKTCAICGEWDWVDRHRCPPRWQCRTEAEAAQ